jgi:cytochrome d ubiquinol oxidase subunit II
MFELLDHDTLRVIWFLLLGVLLAGYAVLDGFDLGVGILHPFIARNDHHRRAAMNSIGPLWDGNEVWLVTFGGAMFAAFPDAYASIFSGFYNAFMLLLFALIFRAVSMEFRSKMSSTVWRHFWDYAFFAGSLLATLLFGVAVGNAMIGIPLNPAGNFTGGLIEQLNPYSLLVGLLAVAMFAMHGAIYLYLKTEGDLQTRAHGWMWQTFGLFLVLYMLTTIYTLVAVPRATLNFQQHPWLWIVPVLNVLAIANIPRAIYKGMPGYAFISSCATILAFVFLLSVALFPNMVASSPSPENSLTIYSASSSHKTLMIMLIIALFGMPCVIAYTAVIYWTFRGKVKIGETSY